MKRIILVHRWDGSPSADWYPWLKEELEKRALKVEIPEMPEAGAPAIKKWVSHLKKEIGDIDERTFFVGHSIGCQAIMRYLERMPEKTKVGGALFVAGWFSLNKLETSEEKAIATPWLETPMNTEDIKKKVRQIRAVFSDNDPFVPRVNVRLFEEKLGARCGVEKNQGHFNDETAPIVLKILLEMSKEGQREKGF